MGSSDPSKGMSTLDATMEDSCGARHKAPWKQMGPVEKEASVHEEMKRMQKLPSNSTYVSHRLRVLNKILQLLSIQGWALELKNRKTEPNQTEKNRKKPC